MSLNNTTSIITSSAISNTIVILDLLSKNFLNHLPIAFTIFGLIGFIGNTLTYLQGELRSNTCCIYSLCGSFVDVSNLFINALPLYLSGRYGINVPWFTLSSLCKFRIFILGFIPHLSINFLLMSIIDRYACTCSLTSFMRRLNQLKMVPWLSGLTIIFSCLVTSRPFFLYDYRNGVGCVVTYPLTNSILYTVLNGVMQPVTMFIFVLFTYRNVHQSRKRVGAIIAQPHRTRNQLISMIFTQIAITGFISLQWMTMYVYNFIPVNGVRTSEQRAIFNFVYSLTNYCYYLNNVKSFYLSLLTSRLFKQIFIKGCVRLLPQNLRHRWQTLQANVSTVTATKFNPHAAMRHRMETAC